MPLHTALGSSCENDTIAERLSAMDELLAGHVAAAEHLAAQLAGLRTSTGKLSADLAAQRAEVALVAHDHDLPTLPLDDRSLPGKQLGAADLDVPLPRITDVVHEEGCTDGPAQAPAEAQSAPPNLSSRGSLVDASERKKRSCNFFSPAAGDRASSRSPSSKQHLTPRGGASAVRSPRRRYAVRAPFFADTEELKEKIRNDLIRNQRDVTSLYCEHGLYQYLARSPRFEAVTLFVVLLSSIWIAVEVDLDSSTVLYEAKPVFQVAAHIICVLFILELTVRFMAFKNRRNAFEEPWFIFDTTLVVFVVFETWFVTALAAATPLKPPGGIRFVIVFRSMRVLKVLRLARLMRELPEVVVIVRGILIAVRAMGAVLSLLSFIIYIAAIVFRVLLEGTDLGDRRFGSVPKSMWTLLLECTLSGSKGVHVMLEAQAEHLAYALLLLLFVLLANVTMMGVLGGLLVHTVKTVADIGHEERTVKHISAKTDEFWSSFHGHENAVGSISELGMRVMLADKSVAQTLANVGVDVQGLLDVSGFIFEQNEGTLSKASFKRMLLDLRSKNTARVKDHMDTRRLLHAQLQRIASMLGPT
mmetsp:Transcript_66794/g.186368  ORF Transcript_66794/g.186368 Transcript_66794/m.186368 type:complete len:587 (+) Transcript_66794:91-1851(+)